MNLSRIGDPDDYGVDVGVAVCRIRDGEHVGVLYRNGDSEPARAGFRLLHLAWHFDLRDEEFLGGYLVVVPSLSPVDSQVVAGLCRRVAKLRALNRIPYAFGLARDAGFDPDSGEWLFDGQGVGLSCSTFVTALFRSAFNPIIETSNWPTASEEDKRRHLQLLELTERSKDPSVRERARDLRANLNASRVRPAHVAGACLEEALPAGYADCEANRWFIEEILARVRAGAPAREIAFTPLAWRRPHTPASESPGSAGPSPRPPG